MLPIISLSFLHMLVQFTEEDRLKGDNIDKKIQDNVPSADIADETNRLKLSQNDLEILEKHLLNPNPPNEALKQAAQRYSDEVREKHTHINDFDAEREKRGELLAEMMKNDEELGLYNEPFDNPLIKEDKEDVSDWDVTLMDGLEDEPPFFTDEEIENILQQEPTEEEIQQNFSTITPEPTNIFQEEYIPSLSDEEIMEMNQQEYERDLDMNEEFDGVVPEPFATPEEVEKYNIDESVKEYFDEKVEEPVSENTDDSFWRDHLYEEVEQDQEEDDLKKKS
jgi:hypothetical protein